MTDATKVIKRCPECGGVKELYLDGGLCSCGVPTAFGLGVLFGATVTTLTALFFDR